MITIKLTQGKQALIDDVDGWLLQWEWYYRASGTTGYAQRKEGVPQYNIPMHRAILERMEGRPLTNQEEADHINGDGLDNRRANLRVASRAQNMQNRKGWGKKVPFKGIRHLKGSNCRKPWSARIYINGKNIVFKGQHSPELAACVYDTAARLVYGEYARPNFPEGFSRALLSDSYRAYIKERVGRWIGIPV